MNHDGTGNLAARLDDVSVEHGESPAGYFRVALEFAPGAELIHAHGPTLMPVVIGENAAHSTELALRAFLLSKMPAVEVRGVSSRHDLEKVWIKAAEEGLPMDPAPPRRCGG
jgi:hypothetical protein